MHNLALNLHRQERYDEARPLYERCYVDCLEQYGEDDPDTLQTASALAGLIQNTAEGDEQKLQEARELYEDVLARRLVLLGAGHEHTIATRVGLGKTLESLADAEGALQQYRIARDVLGPDHPRFAPLDRRVRELEARTR